VTQLIKLVKCPDSVWSNTKVVQNFDRVKATLNAEMVTSWITIGIVISLGLGQCFHETEQSTDVLQTCINEPSSSRSTIIYSIKSLGSGSALVATPAFPFTARMSPEDSFPEGLERCKRET